MICVGCDPDTEKIALAVELEGEWRYELFMGDLLNITQQDHILNWLACFHDGLSKRHFLAEDQFMRKNPQTAIKLAAARGRIEAVAARAGYLVHKPVVNTEWKQAMLGIRRGTKTEVAKRISLERARLISGKNIIDHNIADAMGIAAFLKARVKSSEMLQRGVLI